MAVTPTPESSGGVLKAIKDAFGLFSPTNKYLDANSQYNPLPEDEYESSLNEKDVMELVNQWKQTYSSYYDVIRKSQDMSFDYWIGKQKNEDRTGQDITGSVTNKIFEAVETFLPIATRANPEPLVTADPSPMSQQMANDIKVGLVNWADEQKLKVKLAKGTRGWLLNRIGAWKLSWNPLTKTIELTVVNAKAMIFDKDGRIDEHCQFVGEYTGEKKKISAKKLIEMFPGKREKIIAKCQGKLGTQMQIIEWWYHNTDTFYTLDDNVLLGKYKNPHWNYDGKTIDIDPLTQQEVVTEIQGTNHLKAMTSPYRFLGIFSTGEQPHDNTSLIIQNIPGQDKINRRERQIEKNVEGMNNGIIVSGTAFTEEQASQAAAALRRGVAIRVPNGKVGDSVMFPNRPGLPADVFRSLDEGKQEVANIFGVSGSTSESIESQQTVRGKILINQMDASRIGGGITEYLEQVADAIYNLVVQFMFVYYDEEHFITSSGVVGGTQLIALKNDKFPLLKTLDITVKEGTLVPKDPLTQRNEAIDLWSAGVIDPRSLFKKLDFPDPDEATQQLILWQMFQKGMIPPQAYLPSFQAGQPQQAAPLPPTPGVGGPAVNPIGQPQGAVAQAPQGTPTPVAQASQQLIQQVPIQ